MLPFESHQTPLYRASRQKPYIKNDVAYIKKDGSFVEEDALEPGWVPLDMHLVPEGVMRVRGNLKEGGWYEGRWVAELEAWDKERRRTIAVREKGEEDALV